MKALFPSYKKNGLLLLLFTLSVTVTHAEIQPDFRFEHFRHGLSSSQVNDISQDSLGFLWVATINGLNRFDGVHFDVYTFSDGPESVHNDRIETVFVDSKGRIWAGGHQLVGKYLPDKDKLSRYLLPESSATQVIKHILEDRRGTIWAISQSGNLFTYNSDRDRFDRSDLLSTQNVNDALTDGNHIWIATSNAGLMRLNFESEHVDVFLNDASDRIRNKTHLARDHRGRLWVATDNREFTRIAVDNTGSVRFQSHISIPGSEELRINRLYVDDSFRFWIGCQETGLYVFDPEQNSMIRFHNEANRPHSLADNTITAIHQDKKGRIWVGTEFAGFHLMDLFARRFEHHHTGSRHSNNLNNNVVTGFAEDKNNGVWVATYGGGLNYFDRSSGQFHSYRHRSTTSNALSGDKLTMIKKDREQILWVGSDGGLDLLINQANMHFFSFQQAFDVPEVMIDRAYDAHFDKQYAWIWVALYGNGLLRYKTENSETMYVEPVENDTAGIPSRFIYQIFEDSRNTLWLATANGLGKITSANKEEMVVRQFSNDGRAPDTGFITGNEIRHIAEGADGIIWIASDFGLSRYAYASDSFDTYFVEDGLPSNDLRFVLPDGTGHLWIGTSNGLSKMNPQNETFQNFTYLDGIQGNDYNRGAAIQLSDGTLLFGGTNGFDLLDPAKAQPNTTPPPVYVTKISLLNYPKDNDNAFFSFLDSDKDRLVLNQKQNSIRIDYTALNYSAAHQNQFAYKLRRFDSDWIDAGSRRYVEYRNLPPGRYTFHLKAANNDGIWNDEGVSLSIRIKPPFWRSAWFYLIIAVILFITYKQSLVTPGRAKRLFSRLPFNKKPPSIDSRHEEPSLKAPSVSMTSSEKQNIHAVLNREIKNPCLSIIGFSEYLREKFLDEEDMENKDIMNSILYAAHHTYSILDNMILWANTESRHTAESIDVSNLIKETIDSIAFQAEAKEIEIKINTEEKLKTQQNKDILHSIIRTLVSRIIKNANRSSTIYIEAKSHKEDILLTFSDQLLSTDTIESSKLIVPEKFTGDNATDDFNTESFDLLASKEFIRRMNGKIASFNDTDNTFIITIGK